MHENGIAHRNITLKNIFLDKDYNVKIWGFEFAKQFGIEYMKNRDCIKLF